MTSLMTVIRCEDLGSVDLINEGNRLEKLPVPVVELVVYVQ